MKALMSLGALVGALGLLLLGGMVLDIVPSNSVRLVEGLRQQDSDMDNDVRALLRQLEA